jgi:hypothetical protein
MLYKYTGAIFFSVKESFLEKQKEKREERR